MGQLRHGPVRGGSAQALAKIPALREEFWNNVNIIGSGEEFNQSLEKAGRVADFLELAELMCLDALQRAESCGGHFRVESQTPDGEAKRDDEHFSYSSAWEWKGEVRPSASQGTSHVRARSPGPEELQVAMNLTLKIWRQQDTKSAGKFVTYQVKDVTPDMSFLEMLDLLNEDLQTRRGARGF